MSNLTISDRLFQFTTQIALFDRDTFQRKILDEVMATFNFSAAVYINVVDYDTVFLSDFVNPNEVLNEPDVFDYLSNELFSWNTEAGPYIGSFNDLSVIGVPFQPFTWGIFFASKHPLATDIQALRTFSRSVSIWFDYPFMFHSTEPPIKIDMRSERKYAALQTLYSIAEWEWDIESNNCVISNAFIAFFDHAKIKDCYSITDLYQLIGEDNTHRLKAWFDRVVRT
ncbi:MAG: hypothetical protein VW397_05515, partial [Candidatus Margulisiibacteriota bacterium]